MVFGKQIDENEISKGTETNQQVVIQEETNTNDETTTPQTPKNQTEDTNDVAPPSPDFSNLTTDVGDNPYIRRPPPTESPPIPPKSPPTIVGHNPNKTPKYNLRPNPKFKANLDFRRLDAIISTQLKGKGNRRRPNRTDLTNFN